MSVGGEALAWHRYNFVYVLVTHFAMFKVTLQKGDEDRQGGFLDFTYILQS